MEIALCCLVAVSYGEFHICSVYKAPKVFSFQLTNTVLNLKVSMGFFSFISNKDLLSNKQLDLSLFDLLKGSPRYSQLNKNITF